MNRILLFLLLLCSACSGTFQHKLDFNPQEPLRVAVLPFMATDASGKPVAIESRLLVDNISLLSSEQSETPLQIVRKQVLAELGKSDLDLVSSALIDIDLPHHGFLTDGGKIDVPKVWATNPKELCTKFLNCDAVLYGRLTRWDRSYYGIQTVNAVEIDVKLVSARDGRVLFHSSGEDTESRGLTKGPTGFSSILLEPVRGLDSQIIVDLSAEVVKKVIAPLQAKSRPRFLETAPPSIYGASHDAITGVISPNRPLIVVAFASPDVSASFSIGSAVKDIPMVEVTPGHYYGEYIPVPADAFPRETVTVKVSDQYGRSTEQPIESRAVALEPSSGKG